MFNMMRDGAQQFGGRLAQGGMMMGGMRRSPMLMMGMMAVKLLILAVILYFAFKWLKKFIRREVSDAVKTQGEKPVVGAYVADDKAMATLRERYAKGEIDAEEYAKRKEMLNSVETKAP